MLSVVLVLALAMPVSAQQTTLVCPSDVMVVGVEPNTVSSPVAMTLTVASKLDANGAEPDINAVLSAIFPTAVITGPGNQETVTSGDQQWVTSLYVMTSSGWYDEFVQYTGACRSGGPITFPLTHYDPPSVTTPVFSTMYLDLTTYKWTTIGAGLIRDSATNGPYASDATDLEASLVEGFNLLSTGSAAGTPVDTSGVAVLKDASRFAPGIGVVVLLAIGALLWMSMPISKTIQAGKASGIILKPSSSSSDA